MEPILVIDFGTVYSCSVLVTGDEVKWLHESSSGLIQWPSGVLVDGDDILVGSVADRRKVVRASLYRSEIKRYLSRGEPLDIGGEEYAPAPLVSAVLAAFHAAAVKANNGRPVMRAVLTKPADYLPGDVRNRRMISAAGAAGLGVVELLPEPVAAAYSATVGEEFAPGSILLVYDWGDGTFDAALVRVLADCGEVLASDGLAYCGGMDIDEAVARFLCERDAELGALFASGDKGRVLTRDLADRLKRELSDRPGKLVAKPLKRVFEGRVSMVSDAGLVYLMTDSECWVLDPSSSYLRQLRQKRLPESEAKRQSEAKRRRAWYTLWLSMAIPTSPMSGEFLDLELGQDSLRILVGADRENARWAGIDKQTGRFLREVPQ
ncbi:MAG TPA: Hsp70 family protein [Trebonia sp.]|nr:Hsp70 family protein [Trebonia sp.]